MPLVGGYDLNTRLTLIKHSIDNKYAFKGVTFHGFQVNQFENFNKFKIDDSIGEIISKSNVIIESESLKIKFKASLTLFFLLNQGGNSEN